MLPLLALQIQGQRNLGVGHRDLGSPPPTLPTLFSFPLQCRSENVFHLPK